MNRMISGMKKLARFGAVVAAMFATNALAQCETATLPVYLSSQAAMSSVHVSATPQGSTGATPVTATVTPGQTVTLELGTGNSSISHAWSKPAAAAMIRQNRGNVSLKLQAQAYQSAEILLHSVNGRRVLSGSAFAAKGTQSISRQNLAAGAYVLSVKGANERSFSTKIAHSGGKININVAFDGIGRYALGKQAADDCGIWILTASATGYEDKVYTLTIQSGSNPQHRIEANDLVPETTDPPAGDAVLVAFGGSQATVTNPFANSGVAVSVNGQHVTVNAAVESAAREVEYILSGNTNGGSFKIYSDYRFKLTFNGASVTNPSGPAVNIQSGKRVTVTLANNTANTLTDGQNYSGIPSDEDAKAAFFSEGQLIFGGNGSLNVNGNYRHAICSDDWIRIESGNITVRAATDGIHVNQRFEMAGGTLIITDAGSDGIDVEKDGGLVEITGGTIRGTVSGQGGKGIKSPGNITVSGGSIDFNITGDAYYNAEDDDNKSPAGIKCDGNMEIRGNPEIKINATGSGGKGINSVGTLMIRGGTIDINTDGAKFTAPNSAPANSDNGWVPGNGCGQMANVQQCDKNRNRRQTSSAKGIKSQGNMTINDGNIRVVTNMTRAANQSGAEGIESKANMTINGGEIYITANDDGISVRKDLNITGGKIYAYSSNNDGIDVNGLCWCGNITISGGTVIAVGTTGVEEGIDGDVSFTNGQTQTRLTGGTLVAVGGSVDGLNSNACTQRAVVWNATGNFSQNELVSIKATNGGSEIINFKVPRQYSSPKWVFTSPSLQGGTGYTIYKGGNVNGGTEFNGLYTGATSSGGSQAATFTTNDMVTTVGNSWGW